MHPIPSDAGLIVLLRLPEKGKVKTRLAASVGNEQALRIYQQLVSVTLELIHKLHLPTYLFYEGGLPTPSERNPSYQYHLQAPGDLGSKMQQALSSVLQRHTKAMIIGSDCPDLSPAILESTIRKLDLFDIVLGPAKDGGYYLLGCKKNHPTLFSDIHWSTSSVLEETLDKIHTLNLSYELMEYLADIDTADDWNRYQESLFSGR